MRSRRLALVLGAAALLLAACQEAPRTSLRFGLQSAPLTLDPRFATDAASTRINRLLYSRLVEFDAQSRPVPALGRWDWITPTRCRFVLGAEGRLFHDGTRLTAHDVKATYDFVLDERKGSPHRATLGLIRRIDVVDEDTVDFHLQRFDPLFPGYLVIGIVPRQRQSDSADTPYHPVGSGPLQFLEWPEEGRLRLRRRTDRMEIEFLRVADPTVRVLKLLRGEIDMMQNDLPPELVRHLEHQPGIRVERGRGSNFTYLGFNLDDAVTRIPQVRRAVAHAIDRDAIIRHVLGSAARPADALFPPDHWAGATGLRSYAYDPAAARALLASVGFDAQHRPRIVYKVSSDPLRVRIATILQSQLEAVGFDVQLRSYDWGTFYGDIKAGRFQLYSLSWVGIRTPDIFRYAFHSSSVPPQGANRGHLANAAVDRMIEAAERAPDLDRQAAHYRRLQATLLELLPYVPLWYEDHVFAHRAEVDGYRISPDGDYDGLVTTVRRGGRALTAFAGNGVE